MILMKTEVFIYKMFSMTLLIVIKVHNERCNIRYVKQHVLFLFKLETNAWSANMYEINTIQ